MTNPDLESFVEQYFRLIGVVPYGNKHLSMVDIPLKFQQFFSKSQYSYTHFFKIKKKRKDIEIMLPGNKFFDEIISHCKNEGKLVKFRVKEDKISSLSIPNFVDTIKPKNFTVNLQKMKNTQIIGINFNFIIYSKSYTEDTQRFYPIFIELPTLKYNPLITESVLEFHNQEYEDIPLISLDNEMKRQAFTKATEVLNNFIRYGVETYSHEILMNRDKEIHNLKLYETRLIQDAEMEVESAKLKIEQIEREIKSKIEKESEKKIQIKEKYKIELNELKNKIDKENIRIKKHQQKLYRYRYNAYKSRAKSNQIISKAKAKIKLYENRRNEILNEIKKIDEFLEKVRDKILLEKEVQERITNTPILQDKIRKYKQDWKRAQEKFNKKIIEIEKKIGKKIKNVYDKYKIKLRVELVNIAFISLNKYVYTYLFATSETTKIFEVNYIPILENFSKFYCQNCRRELFEVYQCNRCGDLFCFDCVDKCEICRDKQKLYCIECASELLVPCYNCGDLLCESHQNTCEKCGQIVCQNHINTCPMCSKQICFFDSEPCYLCREEFCLEDLFKCKICENLMCKKDYTLCHKCNENLCHEHTNWCKICGNPFCKDHILECYFCEEQVCEHDSESCVVCRNLFCNECLEQCHICHKKVCEKDRYTCSHCGNLICENDIFTCSICNEKYCNRCYFESGVCFDCRTVVYGKREIPYRHVMELYINSIYSSIYRKRGNSIFVEKRNITEIFRKFKKWARAENKIFEIYYSKKFFRKRCYVFYYPNKKEIKVMII